MGRVVLLEGPMDVGQSCLFRSLQGAQRDLGPGPASEPCSPAEWPQTISQEAQSPQRLYFSPRSFHLTFCVLKIQAATRWRWSLNPVIHYGKEALRGGPEAPGLFRNISPATFTRGSTRNLDAFRCSDWTIALLSLEETNEMRPAADH